MATDCKSLTAVPMCRRFSCLLGPLHLVFLARSATSGSVLQRRRRSWTWKAAFTSATATSVSGPARRHRPCRSHRRARLAFPMPRTRPVHGRAGLRRHLDRRRRDAEALHGRGADSPGLFHQGRGDPEPHGELGLPYLAPPYAVTIRSIHVLCMGGTNVIGGLDEMDRNGANPVAVDSDITATAGTNANETARSPIPRSRRTITFTGTRRPFPGSPTSVTIMFEYTVDAAN